MRRFSEAISPSAASRTLHSAGPHTPLPSTFIQRHGITLESYNIALLEVLPPNFSRLKEAVPYCDGVTFAQPKNALKSTKLLF